jgi:hypothetical protein
VVFGHLRGPDLPHGLDPLGKQRHPGARIGAVVGHLLAVPSGTDPEQEAPAAEPVEAGLPSSRLLATGMCVCSA